MEGTGFLKTVSFGGFDKKDVLAYVDELNTKIYTLEAELDEKKALLESSGGEGGGVDSEKYEELLAADKAKITELQTSNDSLKLQMKTMEDELADKDKEIEALKAQTAELEEQLQEAKNKAASGGGDSNSAMDLSNVFIEAQKTANTIVTQAKENARKMDEDAKKLANQVVDDANGKASTIVKNADEKASRILSSAEDKSSEMRAATEKIRREVAAEIAEIDENVIKLREVLEMFSGESLAKLDEAKAQINTARSSLGGRSAAAAKPSPAPAPKAAAPAPAPTPKPAEPAPAPAAAAEPAPAPTPAPPPAPKPAFAGFDMSELESLAKAAEATGDTGM
ncbi:MAG: hypothetical protein K2N71_10340 [Oscillospiraceae bacterium]|nr:hypothetical protein [Oscillospiraceae bacterium]